MDKILNNNDYCRASKKVKCSVAAIKAVSDTESKGKGFYSDGFPVILYERHIFRKYTNGKFSKTHPHLSGPAGNYGKAGQNQKNKFNEAFELDAEAAMKACSWGKFQIMGFNYEVCGFNSVGQFVDAMKESEGKHLDAFINFVIDNNLAQYLRSLNWAAFAKGYNGTGYKKNKYDTKMASAYSRYEKEGLNCNNLKEEKKLVTTIGDSKPTSIKGDEQTEWPIDGYPQEPKPGESTPEDTAGPGEPVVGGRPGDPPTEVEAVEAKETSGVSAWVSNIRAQGTAAGVTLASLGSIFSGVVTNPTFIYILSGVILIALVAGVLVYLRTMNIKSKEKMQRETMAYELTKLQAEKTSDPTKYNISIAGAKN